MSKIETYISIDIETDGPCPGVNSMLSLGAAVFRLDEMPAGSNFYMTLKPLPEATQNEETMKWWLTQPKAWDLVNREPTEAWEVIGRFCSWADSWAAASEKIVPVAWPAAFDYSFVNYYCHRFYGRNPLGWACMDIRSYAAGLLGRDRYYSLPEEAMRQIAGPGRTDLIEHHALDDAIEQGELLIAMLKTARNGGVKV